MNTKSEGRGAERVGVVMFERAGWRVECHPDGAMAGPFPLYDAALAWAEEHGVRIGDWRDAWAAQCGALYEVEAGAGACHA